MCLLAVCIIFMIWCQRVWGTEGMLVGGAIGIAMFISTVYGRYHYFIDVIIGTAIGLAALFFADALVLG